MLNGWEIEEGIQDMISPTGAYYPPILDHVHQRIIEGLSCMGPPGDMSWETYLHLVLALESVERMRGNHG